MIFCDHLGHISKEPPSVSFLDHGFLFGDSIYEVVRFYDTRPFGWSEHLARLSASAERLGISLDDILPALRERARSLLAELGERNACLRMIITRGIGQLHINPTTCETPRLYLAAWPFGDSDNPGSLRLYVVDLHRNPKTALDPAIKSGNYLNNVMGFKQALDKGFDDAVFLNPDGYVTELTTSNIGWVKSGQAVTPETHQGILHGITRGFFMEWISTKEGAFKEDDLREADEVFALSSLKEVLPVSEIGFSDGSITKYKSTAFVKEYQQVFQDRRDKILEETPALYEVG